MIRINLLPVEEAERAAERRTNLALGSLVLGIMVFVFVVAHVWQTARFASANRQLRRINADISALAGPYADVTRMEQQKKELSEKLRVISQLEAKKIGPVRILAGLSEATPEKLWLTEYADAGGKLKLTGFGADEQTVADFLRKLGVLPVFQSVDLDETSQVTQEGVKLKKFVISGQIDYGAPAGAAQTASGKTPVGSGVAR
jgi:type IV pilus assembly protein PilN